MILEPTINDTLINKAIPTIVKISIPIRFTLRSALESDLGWPKYATNKIKR